MSDSFADARPRKREEMEDFLARTEGSGVAASLRRLCWVSGTSLREVVDLWDDIKDATCHICGRPKGGAGAKSCSYPHPTVEE